MMRNKRVILFIRLIFIASAIVGGGTDVSQSYEKAEMTSHHEVSREAETTTYSPGLALELTTLFDYTRNPGSNSTDLLMTSTKDSIKANYTPPTNGQTNFGTTDQVKKFTTEKMVVVATSEPRHENLKILERLENNFRDTTVHSDIDKRGISSCQGIQSKNFDLINWKNLTDMERSTNVLGMVLPMAMDLVEWFHSYDHNFRNSVANALNEGNFTSNSPRSVVKHFTEVGEIVYVAPTPLSNGTHVSVCFMMKLLEGPQEYLNATDARRIIMTKLGNLSKEFELPSLSVFLGCPAELMVKCGKNTPPNDHMIVIVAITGCISIIIVVIGYIYVRSHGPRGDTPEPDSPNETRNDIPCSSRTDVPHNRDMFASNRHIQRGRRKTSFNSGEHGRNRSGSRLDGPRHSALAREEYRRRNRGDNETRLEVTFM